MSYNIYIFRFFGILICYMHFFFFLTSYLLTLVYKYFFKHIFNVHINEFLGYPYNKITKGRCRTEFINFQTETHTAPRLEIKIKYSLNINFIEIYRFVWFCDFNFLKRIIDFTVYRFRFRFLKKVFLFYRFSSLNFFSID